MKNDNLRVQADTGICHSPRKAAPDRASLSQTMSRAGRIAWTCSALPAGYSPALYSTHIDRNECRIADLLVLGKGAIRNRRVTARQEPNQLKKAIMATSACGSTTMSTPNDLSAQISGIRVDQRAIVHPGRPQINSDAAALRRELTRCDCVP